MNKTYTLKITKSTQKKLKKWLQKNKAYQQKINDILHLLEQNPFSPKLETHPIISAKTKKKSWACRVTGELRIIWKKEGQTIIVVIDFGTHKTVYN